MNFSKKRTFLGIISALTIAISGQAEAALTAISSNGANLVYDSGNNTTWTADANLLLTMETNQGFSTVVNAIEAANGGVVHDTPNIYDNGTHTLTTADFASFDGSATWYGAEAFANYLNTINYGGKNNWALPSQPPIPSANAYYPTTGQFAQLFYDAGGVARQPMPSSLFANQSYTYWTGTEQTNYPTNVYSFQAYDGSENIFGKGEPMVYAWAVSTGNVSSIPVPAAVWLFGSALAGFGLFGRRKTA